MLSVDDLVSASRWNWDSVLKQVWCSVAIADKQFASGTCEDVESIIDNDLPV